MIAIAATHSASSRGCLADSLVKLDTDPLPLTPNSFSKVVHFCANDVVDCFASTIDVFADGFGHLVNRNRLDQLFATIACGSVTAGRFLTRPSCTFAPAIGRPARAWRSAVSRPACTFKPCERSPLRTFARGRDERCDWPAPTRARPEHQGYNGADSCAKQSGGEQVELLLTLPVRIRLADGRAGAASPTRCRFQGICHRAPPPCQMLHEFRFALHAGWTR